MKDKRARARLLKRIKLDCLKPNGRFMDDEEILEAAFKKSIRLRDAAASVQRAWTKIAPSRKHAAHVVHHLQVDNM